MARKRLYSPERFDIDELFGQPYIDNDEERLDLKRNPGIKRMRVKTIKSGNMLECEIFPIWDNGDALKRAPRANKSRSAQNNLNNKNSIKTAVRLINTNFTAADIYMTVTYDDIHLPDTIEAAGAEVYKFIRRLKRYIEKHNLPKLKYLYTTHKGKRTNRIHHHIIMNFADRDVAESLWHGGGRRNAKRLQPDNFEYEGVARYIVSDGQGAKKYVCSQNLSEPQVFRADSKMTKGRVQKLVRGLVDARELFERMYKGYRIVGEPKPYVSEYVEGIYYYVRMRRKE